MPITQRKAGVVLLPAATPTPEHEQAVHQSLATRIAALLGTRWLGEASEGEENLYYLPSQTLIEHPRYAVMGLRNEADFFGGLVSQPFMATKAISHMLFPEAIAPEGWNEAFARQAGDALLGGFTVFNLADAQRAASQLLKQAPFRLKPVRATAGRGQTIIRDLDELNTVLSHMDEEEVLTWGLVLEENLTDVSTYSVGQVRVAGITASYHGTQQLTEDHGGALVYGGSELVVVRGDYAQLMQLELDAATRLAIEQAERYEHAAQACFPGFMASRRNYDIARGTNHLGQLRSGVLEQSWRIGGASSAEILALEAFAANPALTCVRASTHEVFGDVQIPEDATLFYQGDDREVGRITKFARIRSYEHS